MKKVEVFSALAEKKQITKKSAKELVKEINDFVLSVGRKTLEESGEKKIQLPFGKINFVFAHQPKRSGRNPRTGDPVQIEGKFKMSAKLTKKGREILNNS